MSGGRLTRAAGGQLVRFAVIGALGTLGYVGVYLFLRTGLGAQSSGIIARLLLAIPTTWVNGRWTFGRSTSPLRLVLGSAATVGVGAAVTGGLLALQSALLPDAGRITEVGTLVGANLLAALARFLVLRQAVFHVPRAGAPAHRGAPAASFS